MQILRMCALCEGDMRIFDLLQRHKAATTYVVAVVFAFCVVPTFISYKPYVFRWDDAEYLQRSIDVSRAFWSGNVHGLGAAMVSKRPPAMTLLGLPWGPLTSWNSAGKCFITLAAVISLLSALCLYLLFRIGVRPLFLVLASLCVAASLGPFPGGESTRVDATAFAADSLLAWISLAAVLLIPYEARVNCASIKSSISRGFLWAAILSLGAITKISFFYFIVLIAPTLFVIRLRRVGLRGALAALIAFASLSTPVAIYLLHWGRSAFENGGASSFGQVAGLYKVPILPFLSESIRLSPGLIPSLLFIAFGLVYCVIKGRRTVLGPDLLALLITIVFGIIALASPNRQIRYAFPAVVAPPFLIAILLSFKADPISDRPAALAAGLVFLGLLIAGVPTEHRPDRQSINRSEAALTQAVNCNARSIILATDSPTLNMDLMDLAREFWTKPSPVNVSTLAYQAMFGAPIKEDLHAIDEADEVVFQDRKELSPPFTNARVSEYEQYVRQAGYVPVNVGEDLRVYSKRCEPSPGESQKVSK